MVDELGYMIPEKIAIPQHVQQLLNAPRTPINVSQTLPYRKSRPMNINAGFSLPNENLTFMDDRILRKTSASNLSVVSCFMFCKHSRPIVVYMVVRWGHQDWGGAPGPKVGAPPRAESRHTRED